jgi:uncharacterized protein YjgD (DUF1641 family)
MTAEPTTVELAEQIERMSMQLDIIVAETLAQRQAREKWVELSDTLVPVTRGAMDVATRELDDLSDEVTADDLVRFARTAARSLPKIEALMAQMDSLSELMHTLNSLSGAAMGKATDMLAVADEKGYFAFAKEGSKIADRVVTEFSEEDVQALGDNVVTILNAVKEMTQPEVMGLVQRTAISVQDVEETHMEPPSMFALIKQMRDPQTRRGLARVMAMLHTVGEEHPSTPTEEGK